MASLASGARAMKQPDAIRAREAAEVLFEDFRDRLSPHQYERVLAAKRGAIHPMAADAMLRLYTEIVGERQ